MVRIITHNTFVNTRTAINIDSSNLTHHAISFTFQNNIIGHNTYGVFSSEYGTGDNTITNYFDAYPDLPAYHTDGARCCLTCRSRRTCW